MQWQQLSVSVRSRIRGKQPGNRNLIPNEDSDGDYDIGERVDQVTGGFSLSIRHRKFLAATPGGQTAAQITVPTGKRNSQPERRPGRSRRYRHRVCTGKRKRGKRTPETVVSTINAINTGTGRQRPEPVWT